MENHAALERIKAEAIEKAYLEATTATRPPAFAAGTVLIDGVEHAIHVSDSGEWALGWWDRDLGVMVEIVKRGGTLTQYWNGQPVDTRTP